MASSTTFPDSICLLEALFIRFMKLPLEIRIKIWGNATPGPRIVPIVQQPLRGNWERNGYKSALSTKCNDEMKWGVTADCPPPALLLACRESHDAVVHHWEKAFSCASSISETYFNFEQDIFYMTKSTLRNHWNYENRAGPKHRYGELMYISSVDRRKVQNLAISVPEIPAYRSLGPGLGMNLEMWLVVVLSLFGYVKRLILVSPKLSMHLCRVRDLSSLTFIDPGHVRGALLDGGVLISRPRGVQDGTSMYPTHFRGWEIDMVYLQQFKGFFEGMNFEIRDNVFLKYELPEIEWKVCVSKGGFEIQ